MAWTAALDVDVGDATKETDYDPLADNAEYLQVLADIDHDFNVSTGTGYHNGVHSAGTHMVGSSKSATIWFDTSQNLRVKKSSSTTPPTPSSDSDGNIIHDGNAISLETTELTVVDGDIIGRMDWSAPLESSGTDAILVSASIWAEADDTFAVDNNTTSLVFAASTSETAAARMRMNKTALHPHTTDTMSLGTASLNWSDLFLDSGGVIDFDSGNVTVTHSANAFTITGGNFAVGATPDGGGVIDARSDQDGITAMRSINDNGTTAAVGRLRAQANAGAINIDAHGGSYTTSGSRIQDSGLIEADANMSGGLVLSAAAAANMAMWTNGTERMHIDSAGQVGINVTPSSIFHIKNDSVSAYALQLDAYDGSDLFGVWEDSDGTAIVYVRDAVGNAQVQLDRGGDSFFTGGNVGIGISSSISAPLHVQKSVSGNWAAIIHNEHTTNGYGLQVKAGNDAGESAFQVSEYTGTTAMFNITGAGNVGIGTSVPDNTLHVFKASAGSVTGISDAPLVIEKDGNAYINILTPVDTDSGIMFGRGSDNNHAGMFYGSDEQLYFNTNNTGPHLTIDSSGNVGIGTASPNGVFHIETPSGANAFRMERTDTANKAWGFNLDSAFFNVFYDASENYSAASSKLTIDQNGTCYISDSANVDMTVGLTINQGANYDHIVALKSSDVGHGITTIAETDTFALMMKSHATEGGVQFTGISEGTRGLLLRGLHTTDTTTKTTTADGAILVNASLKSGTTLTALGADANIIAFANNGVTRFILDGEGDSHQDVGTAWTNFDNEIDVVITRSLGMVMDKASIVKTKWDDWGRDHKEDLERTGIIPVLTQEQKDNGEHALVNTSQVMRLHNGALWQLYTQIMDMCEKLEDNVPALRGKLLPKAV